MIGSGLYTALITPFKKGGEIDEEGFAANLSFQIEGGVDGLVLFGTTGESPTLSSEEKTTLLTLAREKITSIPLIIGCGTYSTEETAKNLAWAKEHGADGALLVSPYYNKPTQEGLYHHFSTLAKNSPLPIILYNIQGRTGVNINVSTLVRLLEIPKIIGIKEASGNIDQMSDFLYEIGKRREEFLFLAGDDALTFPTMALGGNGIVSVVSNLVPKKMKELVDLCSSGDYLKARSVHEELLPLFRAAFLETNPIPIKAIMQLAGIPSGPPRPPLSPLSPQYLEKIKQVSL
ncbi:MAG: 4-hydroxy-tetrahydrodipicolinate synthase [Chlamydiae bacterium]|nr:4-hydroxy-tetrahydrodipicolinate synthase [Chlamydiota bacterium]